MRRWAVSLLVASALGALGCNWSKNIIGDWLAERGEHYPNCEKVVDLAVSACIAESKFGQAACYEKAHGDYSMCLGMNRHDSDRRACLNNPLVRQVDSYACRNFFLG